MDDLMRKLSRWDLISAGVDCFLSTSHSGAAAFVGGIIQSAGGLKVTQ